MACNGDNYKPELCAKETATEIQHACPLVRNCFAIDSLSLRLCDYACHVYWVVDDR